MAYDSCNMVTVHTCCSASGNTAFRSSRLLTFPIVFLGNFSTTLSTVGIAYGAMHSFDHSRSLERMISLPFFGTTTAATYMNRNTV